MKWNSYCSPDKTESKSARFLVSCAQDLRSWQDRGRKMQRQNEVEDYCPWILLLITKEREHGDYIIRQRFKLWMMNLDCLCWCKNMLHSNILPQLCPFLQSTSKIDIYNSKESTSVQCGHRAQIELCENDIPLNSGLNRPCQSLFLQLMSA